LRTVEEIERAGGVASACVVDIGTAQGATAAVDHAIETFGRLDIVINNAGIVRHGAPLNVDLADFEEHVRVHLTGAFAVSRAAWPHMVSRGYGRIIFTSSPGIFGRANLVSYASAKSGLIGLARCLADAGAEVGIAANLILPVAETRMTEGRLQGSLPNSYSVGKVSALVALLAHESCPCNGEMFYAAGDRVARIVLAQVNNEEAPRSCPEDVVRDWDRIVEGPLLVAPCPWPGVSNWPNLRQTTMTRVTTEP
jgi:NAD(P)-dependent dehydrogenase (short-subunit alcohol dehydrogenase family)